MLTRQNLRASACAAILIMLAGCGHNLPASDFCLIYSPVYISDQDSEETRRQVDGNNAVWLALECQSGKDDG